LTVERLVIAAIGVVVAVAIALLAERRRQRRVGAPAFAAPERIDRDDFRRPDAPWLLAVFTSQTCDTCAAVATMINELETDELATQELKVGREREVHERYGVRAVPLLVLADRSGEVRFHVFGPVRRDEVDAALADATGS
jgi:thioredoxin-related protein